MIWEDLAGHVFSLNHAKIHVYLVGVGLFGHVLECLGRQVLSLNHAKMRVYPIRVSLVGHLRSVVFGRFCR